MDRQQRHTRRRRGPHEGLDRMLGEAMRQAGIPSDRRQAFLTEAFGRLWNEIKEERMNQRIITENNIRNLGIRLPNGTVNKDYTAGFTLPNGEISAPRLDGADELGLELVYSPEDGKCQITGRPHTPGDFTLTLRYRTVEGEPESELRLPIAFNPDPRSLWRNIPTDPKVIYFKPDSATAYVKVEAGPDGTPRKDIVAASQRGRSHAQEGRPRDDHFLVEHCDRSDWYVLAVADGAGSAKFSRKGSEVACDTAVEYCLKRIDDNPPFEQAIRDYAADRANTDRRHALTQFVYDIVLRGAQAAHKAVSKLADLESDTRVKDFATTLMFAICKRFDFGWFVASFWVGDGAMCLISENGDIKLLGTPDEGEFSGQTRFLTMPEIFRDRNVYNRLKILIEPDFQKLLLMTDGVSDPMFETDRNLNDPAKWRELLDRLAHGFPADGIGGVDLDDDNEKVADQLLGWLDFWSPGNHDDRTIAILY